MLRADKSPPVRVMLGLLRFVLLKLVGSRKLMSPLSACSVPPVLLMTRLGGVLVPAGRMPALHMPALPAALFIFKLPFVAAINPLFVIFPVPEYKLTFGAEIVAMRLRAAKAAPTVLWFVILPPAYIPNVPGVVIIPRFTTLLITFKVKLLEAYRLLPESVPIVPLDAASGCTTLNAPDTKPCDPTVRDPKFKTDPILLAV